MASQINKEVNGMMISSSLKFSFPGIDPIPGSQEKLEKHLCETLRELCETLRNSQL